MHTVMELIWCNSIRPVPNESIFSLFCVLFITVQKILNNSTSNRRNNICKISVNRKFNK